MTWNVFSSKSTYIKSYTLQYYIKIVLILFYTVIYVLSNR